MRSFSQQLGDFRPTTAEGDPGKLAYLHNADWAPKPFEELGNVKAMPGTCLKCVFDEGLHAAACDHYVVRSAPWDTSQREAD